MVISRQLSFIAGFFLVGISNALLADTYTGSALGYNGNISVEIDWDEGNIVDIRVTSHSDTPAIAEPAFNELAEQVLETQSTDIDAVSGATDTSRGFLQAIEQARNEAEGGAPEEARSGRVTATLEQEAVDGRYRGNFGDRGEQQVGVQFDLVDGVLRNISFRNLYYSGEDYLQMASEHPLYPVLQQHEHIIAYMEGVHISYLEALRDPGDMADDIDGFSGATIRGNKLYSAFRDALNRGVYTPAGSLALDFGQFVDGRYRGTFSDRGEQQVSIQFDLVDNRFDNLRFRHLAYSGTDYRSLESGDQLYPVTTQHQEILDHLEGKELEAIASLFEPQEFLSDIDGFSGATVRANKVASAIMNALSRNVYTPTDVSSIALVTPEDGRYRGVFEDGGVQQVSVQFTIENGVIRNPSFRHLYYAGTDYRTLREDDHLYPVLQQHDALLESLDGLSFEDIRQLHEPETLAPDIDGFSGATLRGNKIFSAILDAVNRGIY